MSILIEVWLCGVIHVQSDCIYAIATNILLYVCSFAFLLVKIPTTTTNPSYRSAYLRAYFTPCNSLYLQNKITIYFVQSVEYVFVSGFGCWFSRLLEPELILTAIVLAYVCIVYTVFFLLVILLFFIYLWNYFPFSSLSLSVTRFILRSLVDLQNRFLFSHTFVCVSISLALCIGLHSLSELFFPSFPFCRLFVRQIASNLFENNSYLMNTPELVYLLLHSYFFLKLNGKWMCLCWYHLGAKKHTLIFRFAISVGKIDYVRMASDARPVSWAHFAIGKKGVERAKR